jgi:hypothetical protein
VSEPWHGEESPCFVCDLAELRETAAMLDDVEQIAIFAGRLVDLMCS